MNTTPLQLHLDYNNHPAFSPYLPQPPLKTTVLDEIFAEIDTNLRLLRNTPEQLSTKFIRAYFANQIDPIFKELLEGTCSIVSSSSWYYPLLPLVLRDTRNCLQDEIIYRNENKRFHPAEFGATSLGESLKGTSVAFIRMPREEVAKIWDALQPFKAEVFKTKEKAPWEVAGIALPHEGRYWELTVDLLRQSGVPAAITHAHNCPMELLHVSFALSRTDEVWYKNCYQDVGLPTSRTAYMHFDHSFDVVKMMLYFTDVTKENGPFCVIPNSRNLIKSYTQAVLWKWMDWHADSKAVADPRYEARYRRKRYLFPELRKELMTLPNELRGTSHFGEDILDNSPMSNTLLEHEVVCTSDFANCVIFDGACTIHRGGLVQKGERWAFQLGFARPKHLK